MERFYLKLQISGTYLFFAPTIDFKTLCNEKDVKSDVAAASFTLNPTPVLTCGRLRMTVCRKRRSYCTECVQMCFSSCSICPANGSRFTAAENTEESAFCFPCSYIFLQSAIHLRSTTQPRFYPHHNPIHSAFVFTVVNV